MTEPVPVVFVVDDDAAMRTGLESLLRSVGLTVQTYASAAEFLASPQPDAPACLVLDVRLPGTSGLDLQRELAERYPALPIVFITGHGDIPMTVRAMRAGAVEFLTKPFRHQDLLDAVQQALERARRDRRAEMELRALRAGFDALTRREREVLDLVLAGMLNKQIAYELGISDVTVKVHRAQVMQKTGAKSPAELAGLAARVGIGPARS